MWNVLDGMGVGGSREERIVVGAGMLGYRQSSVGCHR